MACKVLEGVLMDACLNQEQRHQLSKQISSVVWLLREDDQANKEDDPATKDYAYVAGVCISPMGYILTSSHVVKPGVRYFGKCPSWKAGWISMSVVKKSITYGLSLLQVEGKSRKRADYTSVAESGILGVNQHVYGFGHPNLFEFPCTNTFVRGSVEYPCENIVELPTCFNDLDHLYDQLEELDVAAAAHVKPRSLPDCREALALTPRMVKHLKGQSVGRHADPKTILLMHQDIPLVQIKNFHLGYCGGPVLSPSGHLLGINIFKFHDINFAVHLSAIKEFLKDVDLSVR